MFNSLHMALSRHSLPTPANPDSMEGRDRKPWLRFLVNSHMGLIYWTLLVEFLRNVFWFQLKRGTLAPEFGFIAVLLMPSLVLGWPCLSKRLDYHPRSRAFLVICGIVALLGFSFHNALHRLTSSASGVGLLGVYVWEGMWTHSSNRRVCTAAGLVGGALLLQILRWAYAGPNPLVATWWGFTLIGLVPGVYTVVLLLREDLEGSGEEFQSIHAKPDQELVSGGETVLDSLSDTESQVYIGRNEQVAGCLQTLKIGIGFGSLLFVTHWLLTAPTTFPRWHGLNVENAWVPILSLSLGMLVATEALSIPFFQCNKGFRVWLVGGVGASLFLWHGNGAVLGGALLAFAVPTFWIVIARDNAGTYQGIGLGILAICYVGFVLWSTSLVAYQFIPELGFLRGSRGILVGFAIVGICVGLGTPSTITTQHTNNQTNKAKVSLPAVWALIALVGTLGAVALAVRTRLTPGNLAHSQLKVLNINVQQGFSRAGIDNYDTVLAMLKQEQPHVIMLQETDLMHIVHGNLDMIDYWATWLKMYSFYSPPSKSDTWGCALLSAFPFTSAEGSVLLSPQGENACFQHAVVELDGRGVHLLNTHFGVLESDIFLQAQQTAKLLKEILHNPEEQNPYVVFGGDLNVAPLSTSYNLTVASGIEDAHVSKHGQWKGAWERDAGAGYLFHSSALSCSSWTEPHYDQHKTTDGYPVVATFEFM